MNKPDVIQSGSDTFIKNMLSLVYMLRQAGLAVSSDQVMDFIQALKLVNLGDRAQVYHAARCILVSRYEHLALFETIFNIFWNRRITSHKGKPQKTPRAPRHEEKQNQPVLITYMSSKARAGDPELDVYDKSATYSNAEVLQRKDFAQMTPEELDAVKRLIQEMRWRACFRQSRRRIPSRTGDMLHMRRVIASAVRHGGVPLALTWQSRKIKQRPIILIADISGSMEKYARLALQFFYSVSQSLKNVECFVFGTRLTRITLQLKIKNIDRAVTDAAAEVVDWAGGTRIGESLAAFNHQWGRRMLRRGAVVMIVSDGWERGDAAQLSDQMRYLQLRAYRLIWLNPLVGKANYQPQVEGMAAALPHIDDFLPIHNLQSLSTLAAHLEALSS